MGYALRAKIFIKFCKKGLQSALDCGSISMEAVKPHQLRPYL